MSGYIHTRVRKTTTRGPGIVLSLSLTNTHVDTLRHTHTHTPAREGELVELVVLLGLLHHHPLLTLLVCVHTQHIHTTAGSTTLRSEVQAASCTD